MKRFLLVIVLLFMLASCSSFSGRIIEKKHVDEWYENVPPGYRYDCSISMDGKFECGYKFFVTSKIEHHPEQYLLVISDGKCSGEVGVDKNIWEKAYIGQEYTFDGLANCNK